MTHIELFAHDDDLVAVEYDDDGERDAASAAVRTVTVVNLNAPADDEELPL